MKRKTSEEFDTFDKAMRGLLAVPYKELQQEIAQEKKTKAQKKRTTSTASRASAARKT